MLVIAAAGTTHSGTWQLGSDFSSLRYGTVAATVGDIVYVIGGTPNVTVVDTVEAYDPVGRNWSSRAPMPTPRSFAAAAVVDGMVYVFGGLTDSSGTASTAVEAYDPATDSWEPRSSMPEGLWGPAAATIDGRIYVIGGATGNPLGTVHSYYTNTWIYDPDGDSWSNGAAMLTPRAAVGAVVIDDILYAVGGKVISTTSAGDESLTVTGALHMYDPAADSWREGTAMSVPREGLGTAVVNGRIYAFGGLAYDDAGLRVVADVEVYDSVLQTWQRIGRMPLPRWSMSAAVVNGVIHLFGGSANNVASGHKAVDSYQPDLSTYWTELVAHGAGSFGSQWRSDVCAANLNADSAQLTLELYTEGNVLHHTADLSPFGQRQFEDVVAMMGIEGKGMLAVGSDRPLRVTGRTFSEESAGSFGHACAFRVMDDGLWAGETAWLVGLRQQSGSYRTNLSIANAGTRLAMVRYSLYDNDGAELYTSSGLWLQNGEARQELAPFADLAGAPDVGWGYAEVEVIIGAGVLVSASVIDSRTNDATIVMAQR